MYARNIIKKGLSDTMPMTDKGGEISILLSPGNTGNERMIMGYGLTPVGESVKEHIHPYSEECFFVIEGKGSVTFGNGDIIEFEANEAIRIPQNMLHTIKNTGEVDLRVIFASGPLAPTMQKGHINGGNNEKNN